MNARILLALSTLALLGGAAAVSLSSAGCASEDDPRCLVPEGVDTSVPMNQRDPVTVEDPWIVFTCEQFPANDRGFGRPCASHSDCADLDGQFCLQGLLPCGGGFCTTTCRMDSECTGAPIDYDYIPDLVCVMPHDGLSACLPSTCLPRVPGWDETCGPLSGVRVNDYGIGHACSSDADCAEFPGTICPGGGPEAHCTKTCQTDADCGPGAACTCVDNPQCTEQNFVCAPALDCAEAVRHHHCRGEGIPPRDHEVPCGNHEH